MTVRLRLSVRSYEIDMLGHVNHAVYHQWGELGRVELFRAAGCDFDVLRERGISPVMLESHIRFLRELRGVSTEVEVDARATFGEGKTFRIRHEIRLLDGTLSADIDATLGMFDLTTRRLVPGPRELLASIATSPELLDSADVMAR